MQSETGFGRSGERMANTPFSADVPGGIARRTVRSARSNQQRTHRCFLPSICQRAGRYFSSTTISEIVSDRRPCRGASPFALYGERTEPMGWSSMGAGVISDERWGAGVFRSGGDLFRPVLPVVFFFRDESLPD